MIFKHFSICFLISLNVCIAQHFPANLHSKWNDLLQKHVSAAGLVDYKKFKDSKTDLDAYIKTLQANFVKIDSTSKSEKLAYWINTYNALTIDLILRNYPTKSIKQLKKPWKQKLWKFGNQWLNLNDIEHQILRKMNEPRIHFAINCASMSCPILLNEAFTAQNIEKQLNRATLLFLSDKSKNNITENNLQLSKIFKWFENDFKTEGSLIDFLNLYTEIQISNSAKISYLDYDWGLNGS